MLDRQDEMGLLRVMEPGGGRFAIAGYGKNGELSDADRFARDYQVEKCVAMVRAFRSHPRWCSTRCRTNWARTSPTPTSRRCCWRCTAPIRAAR
ncbi:hypothetical protein ACFSLT_01165 [Novosphingobium resinovorum]